MVLSSMKCRLSSTPFPLPIRGLGSKFSSTVHVFMPFQTVTAVNSTLPHLNLILPHSQWNALTNVCEQNRGWQKMPVGWKQTRKIFYDFRSRIPDTSEDTYFQKGGKWFDMPALF